MPSYRKKHVKNKIYKIKPKKSIFKKLWFWLLVLVLVLVLLSSYLLLFYQGLQVESIFISGNQKVKTYDLEEIISGKINIKLIDLGFLKLSTKSILLINPKKINQEILVQFPVIKTISINKKYPKTLMLSINERKPIGVYCAGDTTEEYFLIDEDGIIFEKLDLMPDNTTIVRQTFKSGNVFTGKEVVSSNVIRAITEIQKNLKDNFQIDLKEVFVVSPLRMNVTINEGWQIYFSLDPDSNINTQLVKLNLLLSGEIPLENRKNLEYIDLRFKDRAFYK